MKKLIALLSLAIFVLAACAPQSAPAETPAGDVPVASTATQLPATEPAPAATVEEVTAVTPEAVATSRGDELFATDPASVNLASGKPYLVEFFRFT